MNEDAQQIAIARARAEVKKMETLAEKWAVDARDASESADNLRERVDLAKACILALNRAIDAASQQGGAE